MSLFKKSFLVAFNLGLCFLVVTGCQSPNVIKSEVINNSNRTLKTPDWVLTEEPMREENDNFVFAHKVYLDGAARPDACVSMARTQASGEMMKYIKNSVTTSGQVEDLNGSNDPSYSSLTAFLSQGNLSGAKVKETYWEQTLESDSTGIKPVKKLMCAVKVTIEKQILDKQMRDAISGAPGGNPEVRRKLLDAQKNFIDSVGESSSVPAH